MSNSRRRQPRSASKHTGPAAPPTVHSLSPSEGSDLLLGPEVSVFLSYARKDDRHFGHVRPFTSLLEALVHAKTGRHVKVFVDRTSIAWGDKWEDSLNEGVLNATVFIPLLSANYLESEMCRMEFNTFYSAAEALGVTELMLPVLIIDAPQIFRSDSDDQVVQIAISHQYELIESAVLSDAGSSDWKRTMAHLADRFALALARAEDRIGRIESIPRAASTLGDEKVVEDDADAPGLAELLESLTQDFEDLTDIANQINPAIEQFGDAAASAGNLPDNPSPRDIQTWSIRLAAAFRPPAQDLELHGERLYAKTRSLDETMIQLRQVADTIPEWNSGLRTTLEALTGMGDVRQVMTDLLQGMRPAENLSVPLRQALRPARSGVTRISDSLAIIEGWTRWLDD